MVEAGEMGKRKDLTMTKHEIVCVCMIGHAVCLDFLNTDYNTLVLLFTHFFCLKKKPFKFLTQKFSVFFLWLGRNNHTPPPAPILVST